MASTYLSAKFKERTVNEKALKFYPTSVGAALKLRNVIKVVTAAFLSFFQSAEDFAGAQFVTTEEERADGSVLKVTQNSRPSKPVEVTKFRAEQQERTVKDAVEVLTDPKNHALLAELIADSLRDECGGDARTPATVKKLAEEIQAADASTFFELLKGLADANEEIFRPLVKAAPDRLKSAMAGAAGSSESSEQSPTP